MSVRVCRTSYRWPAPYDRESDWVRFHHRDLPDLHADALWRERHQTEQALADLSSAGALVIIDAVDGPMTAGQWLRDRLQHLTDEEGRRGYRA